MTDRIPLQIVQNKDLRSYEVPGMTHETLAGPAQGMGTLEVWRQRVQPGGETPVHRHDCEEVFVISEGSGTIRLEEPGAAWTERPFDAGSTVIVSPGLVHQVVNSGQGELIYLAILGMSPVALETQDGNRVDRPWLSGKPGEQPAG